MDTVKIQQGQAKLIAHRGLSGIECENTNAAFVAAANRAYYGMETDVYVTRDGKFVLFHDGKTGRIADADISIERSRFKKLAALQLKNPRQHETENGVIRRDLRISTPEEYLSICKKYGKVAVIELKSAIAPAYIQKLIQLVEAFGYLDSTIFISFTWENLTAVRQLLPNQSVQVLTDKCNDALIEKLKTNAMDMDIHYKALTKELVQKLHESGIKVNCWTCDDPEAAKELIDWGVDYLTTNILE